MREASTKYFPNGRVTIPEIVGTNLDLRETERGIKFIKDHFQMQLANTLNLQRVSAPLFVPAESGINDYLSGKEMPVSFTIKAIKTKAEIVQSLAKWKRVALADYGFKPGEGLYTDMNAIRPNEYLDNLHSVYVDQWDWELIIGEEERNLNFLKSIVRKIYRIIHDTEKVVCDKYPQITGAYLPENISFIHSEELLDLYPDMPPVERENQICREKGAVFVIGIGAKLKDGKPHDERASDYDDWITETSPSMRGLNGDILVWNPLLKCAFELSSMGIRVDKKSLLKQLELKNEMHKKDDYFHKRLLNNDLPLTIGGGIGQSRLCMLFLRKSHIGEVQSSIWPDEIRGFCEENDMHLL